MTHHQVRYISPENISAHQGNLKLLENAIVSIIPKDGQGNLNLVIKVILESKGRKRLHNIIFPITQIEIPSAKRHLEWTRWHNIEKGSADLHFMGHSNSIPQVLAFLNIDYGDGRTYRFRGVAWHCRRKSNPNRSKLSMFVAVNQSPEHTDTLNNLQQIALMA